LFDLVFVFIWLDAEALQTRLRERRLHVIGDWSDLRGVQLGFSFAGGDLVNFAVMLGARRSSATVGASRPISESAMATAAGSLWDGLAVFVA